LRKIAFELDTISGGDASRRQLSPFTKDYKKLGFKYDINPALDFTETPPGMLALDCMVYFARNHVDAYTKVRILNYLSHKKKKYLTNCFVLILGCSRKFM